MDVMKRVERVGVVPVVVLDNAALAPATANAMQNGGIDVMEITFRTQAAAEAIHVVAQECPGMCVGAGTVVTLEQCKQALDAGASFIVSPGFKEDIVRYCVDQQIPVLPGCVTPSEIMAAMNCGLQVTKFFPASIYGGLSAMKSLSAPFPQMKFIPTGGVNAANLEEYLRAPYVYAVGGSWLCARTDIEAQNFAAITQLCAQAHAIVERVRTV